MPAYSPELNPDEYLNNNLKGELNRGAPVRSQMDMIAKVQNSMEVIQDTPERVANYFQHPKIKYAL